MQTKPNVLRVIKNGKWTTVENELTALQREVGGYIECVTLFDGIVLIVDEEGRLKDKPVTCTVCDAPIFGDWILCGAKRGAEGCVFTDLKDDDWRILKIMEVIKWEAK